MATKGVLGNDPFQRGAAQRPSDSKPASAKAAKKAPKAAKKAPAPKPEGVKAPKAAKKAPAPKPAAAKKAAKKAEARAKPARSEAPRTAEQLEAEALTAARAELGVAPPETEERGRAEEREPAVPAPAPEQPEVEEAAVEEAVLERVAEAVAAAEAIRELEEALGETIPTTPVSVPGFEDITGPRLVEAVEVLDPTQDEYAPRDVVEAVAEARIEVEVEAALAPALPASSGGDDVFFTSESPGARPQGLGHVFSGMLSLMKEAAFQALASERFGQTVGSAQGLLSATFTGLGVGGGTSVDEYGKDASLVGVLRPVLDFLYERYWRVSVQGASHVPNGPVLLVANHSGALPFDGPMLQMALARERPDLQEARWLAEDQVFHAPVVGTLANRLGAVRACPENALRLLDELRPVIVFPEGIQGLGKPFAERYHLKRFGRGGFVKLALRTGAPIIPVAVVGAEETAPLFGKLPGSMLGLPYLPLTTPPLPARWTIRFGDPITMEGFAPEAADDLSQVQKLTERTRESIQGMLQALLKDRRSVFTG